LETGKRAVASKGWNLYNRTSMAVLIRLLRVHQWVKNLLIFIPLVMAHKWNDGLALSGAMGAFFSFSLIASSVYILNDLADRDSDRHHPTKKNRPIVSGAISPSKALFFQAILFSLGFTVAMIIKPEFLAVLGIYFVLTTAYTIGLKKVPLVDILLLASLYSIRIFAGSVATDIIISKWLIAFSMFLFFNLACVKRYAEIAAIAPEHRQQLIRGRGYSKDDLQLVGQFGVTSGFLSILVLALYLNSEEVTLLYRHPDRLWFICPFLFYWVGRVWLKTTRNQMHDDPVVFALKDIASYAVGIMVGIIILAAL